jgi:hypothetical protein
MTTDSVSRLQSAKENADQVQQDRDNYAAYVESMREFGWTDADVAEYRVEVERIMASGTEDEKAAAREFWRDKAAGGSECGINGRIGRSIAEEKRRAA